MVGARLGIIRGEFRGANGERWWESSNGIMAGWKLHRPSSMAKGSSVVGGTIAAGARRGGSGGDGTTAGGTGLDSSLDGGLVLGTTEGRGLGCWLACRARCWSRRSLIWRAMTWRRLQTSAH